MKSLRTVQSTSKVLKIIFKVLFILSLVGAGFCLLGAVVAGVLPSAIPEEELKEIIEQYPEAAAYLTDAKLGVAAVLSSMITLIGSAIIYKFAEIYFKHELEDGTPFTKKGSKELMRLGIITLVVPLVTSFISTLMYSVIIVMNNGQNVSFDSDGGGVSIWLGVALIIVSLVFRYGAELEERVKANDSFNQSQNINFDDNNGNNYDNGNNNGNNDNNNGIFYV